MTGICLLSAIKYHVRLRPESTEGGKRKVQERVDHFTVQQRRRRTYNLKSQQNFPRQSLTVNFHCEFSSRFHSDSKRIRSGFGSKRHESPRIHNVFAQQYGFANFGRIFTVIRCETLSWVTIPRRSFYSQKQSAKIQPSYITNFKLKLQYQDVTWKTIFKNTI